MSLKKVVFGVAFVASVFAGTAYAEGTAYGEDAATCEAHIKAVEARLGELKDQDAGKKALDTAKKHQESGDFKGCTKALETEAKELKL